MMVEVEEIELDLELSIGGGKGTTVKKSKPESEPGGVVSNLDPKQLCEVRAMRRMEAKRKREMKRGTDGDRVGEYEPSEPECQSVFKREKKDFLDGSWTTTPFQQAQQYADVQFVPLNNGGLPLPCWFPNVGGIDGVNSGDGKARSNGSSRCSSSAVSDYQCEDVGSADSHSHSGNSSANLSHMTGSKEINIRIQPEESASSNPIRPKNGNNLQDNRNHNNVIKETQTQPNIMHQPNSMKLNEEASAATNNKLLPLPILNKPLPNENSTLKETKVDNLGKSSSKPLTQTSSSLPQMPYVSTKGNGPNGKTVNGFLYRYSKSEVSIICVCHGSTFSPAEFVQHAGGTDISQPLRHITVIPSAFG